VAVLVEQAVNFAVPHLSTRSPLQRPLFLRLGGRRRWQGPRPFRPGPHQRLCPESFWPQRGRGWGAAQGHRRGARQFHLWRHQGWSDQPLPRRGGAFRRQREKRPLSVLHPW